MDDEPAQAAVPRLVVVSAAYGSLGDLQPMMGLALELQKDAANRVVMVVDGYFEDKVKAAGLEAVALGTREEYAELLSNEERNPQRVMRELVLGRLRPHYAALEALLQAGPTATASPAAGTCCDGVLVAQTLDVAARCFEEKHPNVCCVTVIFQPWLLRCYSSPPQFELMPVIKTWWPHFLKSLAFKLADYVVDAIYCPPLNAFRAELGLAPTRRIYHRWFLCAHAVALFPAWFASAPDWPPQLRLAGFPLFDESDGGAGDPQRALELLPPSLRAFVDAARRSGRPIVAVTLGSAPPPHAVSVFAAAVAATGALGARCVLLSADTALAGSPRMLPPHAIHCAYAPFGALLQHCAAILYNGGIGTCGQALRAGVPQLVVPLRWDQPDNAIRVVRLGVGLCLPLKHTKLRVSELEMRRKLRELLGSAEIRLRCAEARRRFESDGADAAGGLALAARAVAAARDCHLMAVTRSRPADKAGAPASDTTGDAAAAARSVAGGS